MTCRVAHLPSPRALPAVHARQGHGPVAALLWSLSTMQPCAHLLSLSEACQDAAAPLIDAEVHRPGIMAILERGTRTYRDTLAEFELDALRAHKLKQAEQLLRQLAHDPDFQRFAEARAAGRVLVVQEADRAGPVVVAREHDRPAAQPVRAQRPAKAFLAGLWPFGRVAA